MASKRRGGFRPPELRGTLGTLLRTTTGVVRDALERGAREGRARLDSARASRRRRDALADLGELVLDLIRRGEIDLGELPEARELVRELDELDDTDAAVAEPEPEPPRPAVRRRFDDRARTTRGDSGDDGTVSSGAALRSGRPTPLDRPPRGGEPPSSRTPTKPMRGSSRPRSDDSPDADRRSRIERWDSAHTSPLSRADRSMPAARDTERENPAAAAERPAAATERPDRDTERPDRDTEREADRDDDRERSDRRSATTIPRDPARKGGISFEDDDLADYMHPDDVPPKPAPPDPDDHDA
jgi:hypothetical protein